MKIDPRISKFYFINLDKRQDRLVHITNELKKVGIENAVRIPGVNLNSITGANRSHILAFLEAEKDDAEYYIVFEDDAVFHNNAVEKINNAFNEVLKREWGILFLGCRPNTERLGFPPLQKLKDNTAIMKVNSAHPTHAIIYNRKYALEFNQTCQNLYPFDNPQLREIPYDVLASRFYCHRDLGYCTYDVVASQKTDDMSDVCQIETSLACKLQEDFEKYKAIAPVIDEKLERNK